VKTFRSWELEQRWLLPPSVLDFVPADDPAHLIRDLVRESLDLSEIYAEYTEERGYPPYHPAMMTALILYAYSQGVFSSRKIARACVQRVDFMAVTGLQKPNFRTVTKFRARHLRALGELFVQVLALCREAGLVKLGHIAIDGTKMQANASKHKAMSYGRMTQAEKELDAVVRGWFEQAEEEDRQEDKTYGEDNSGDEMPDWVANKEKRLQKIREAKAALEAEAQREAEQRDEIKARGRRPKHNADGTPSDKSQRNFTDPDSKILKSADGYVQGYNGQIAVDAEHQIIVAHTLTNRQNDVDMLDPVLAQVKRNMGRQAKEVSADAGYCSESNLRRLNRRHIRGYIATGRQSHGDQTSRDRLGQKPGTATYEMRLRISKAGVRSRYRLRKQIVEPVFGHIKAALGFTRFLLRGLEKVRAEWALVCMACNLRKLTAAR
jgi:transposase